MLKAVVVAESWLVLSTLLLAARRHVLETLSWKLELLVVAGAGKLTWTSRVVVLELLMVQIHSVVMMLVVVVLAVAVAVAVVVEFAAGVASLQRMDPVCHIVVVVDVVGVVDNFADVAVELDAKVIVAAVGGDVDSAAVDGDEDCVVVDVDVDFVVFAAVVVNEREVVAAVVAHDVAVEFVVAVAGLDLSKLSLEQFEPLRVKA